MVYEHNTQEEMQMAGFMFMLQSSNVGMQLKACMIMRLVRLRNSAIPAQSA